MLFYVAFVILQH